MDNFHLIEQLISSHFSIIESNASKNGIERDNENKDDEESIKDSKNTDNNKEEVYFIVDGYNKDSFRTLVQELDPYGYIPFINPHEDHYKISIGQKPKKGKSRIHINVILLFATICTTISAGYLLSIEGNIGTEINIWSGNIWTALAFSIALLGIIGTHETAHYFAARKHRIHASLPYFIPAPTIIGTFGAVINVKSPIPDKNALFDLGYSGPLAGFLVAIPVLIIGLYYSTITINQNAGMVFPDPLIIKMLLYIIFPNLSSDQMVFIHPVAFAGWVGIVVTMLNLMPVAFLDGGHISRSLFSQKVHRTISILGIVVTVLLGWYLMAVLMIFIFFWGKSHPGALDNVMPISRNRKIMAVLILAIFILCLTPYPIINV